MDKTKSPDERADLLIGQMTIDEKISLVHGVGYPIRPSPDPAVNIFRFKSKGGAGFIPGIPRLGIPDMQQNDSSYGVTRGGDQGRYATALPATITLAASWDTKLANEYGSLIGREMRDNGFNMSLAGGINLTREPRNGRLFEYLGEDPILAGKTVAQFIKGIQAQGMIGCIKHYALNDQETGRDGGFVKLDKRAMRESDLLAFEIGVKEGQPGSLMCAYNRVNGDYSCENSYLLNDVLKKEWGFKGFVLSDWGATHSTAKAALAGLDQEMPGSRFFGAALKTAVESGEVPPARLNDMVHRILRSEFADGVFDNPPAPKGAGHLRRLRTGTTRRGAGDGAAEEQEPVAAERGHQVDCGGRVACRCGRALRRRLSRSIHRAATPSRPSGGAEPDRSAPVYGTPLLR